MLQDTVPWRLVLYNIDSAQVKLVSPLGVNGLPNPDVSGPVKMSQNWRFKNADYDEGGAGVPEPFFFSSDTSW